MEETQPKIKWVSMGITLLATINTIAIAFGSYHFTNEGLQMADNVISAIGDIYGTILSHRAFTK